MFAAGLWTAALLVLRLFDKPGISSHGIAGNVGVQWGIFFALAAAGLLAYAGGRLRATGFLILFYCGVLFTEGIGVYFEQRWAEFLMIIATGALIPLELRHLWHRPSPGALVILLANCFIVWFLYRILKRDKAKARHHQPKELVETR